MPGEILIDGYEYTVPELKAYAFQVAGDETNPPWKREVFRFIQLWLSEPGYIVQQTSGTTGRSKEIKLPRQSVISSAVNTCRYFGLEKGQNALLCLPAEYIAGKMMIVRAFTCGLNLLLTEPKGTPDLPGTGRIDFCAMVPLQVTNLLDSGSAFSTVQKLIIGGAEISEALENRIRDLPVQAYTTYGMAETCSHIALRKLGASSTRRDYFALPGIDLALDERGCLVIKADYLPETVITNDLAELTGGNSFRWIGRYDNLINSGGMKVVPEALEEQIRERTGQECAVIGLPDRKLGRRLILVMEKRMDPAPELLVKTELQKLLPHQLQPREIIRVDQFPRNHVHKLDRLKLTEMVHQML
ncbi:MAG TPA: AMP-binding protein [Bacteroidales bacterium]|nr:AMP-binding protein [Bacteroidales bacterium]